MSEKFAAKVPTLSYAMVKIACLDDTFSEIFEMETSPVECQLMQQKDKKRRKRRDDQKKTKKLKVAHLGHFLVQNYTNREKNNNMILIYVNSRRNVDLEKI